LFPSPAGRKMWTKSLLREYSWHSGGKRKELLAIS
jgi:hypothetical protein